MAYSDFTSLKQLEKAFNVSHKINGFLANSLPQKPTYKAGLQVKTPRNGTLSITNRGLP